MKEEEEEEEKDRLVRHTFSVFFWGGVCARVCVCVRVCVCTS